MPSYLLPNHKEAVSNIREAARSARQRLTVEVGKQIETKGMGSYKWVEVYTKKPRIFITSFKIATRPGVDGNYPGLSELSVDQATEKIRKGLSAIQ